MARLSTGIDLMGKAMSTEDNLGNDDVGLVAASERYGVGLY